MPAVRTLAGARFAALPNINLLCLFLVFLFFIVRISTSDKFNDTRPRSEGCGNCWACLWMGIALNGITIYSIGKRFSLKSLR